MKLEKISQTSCPLCGERADRFLMQLKHRKTYFHCLTCDLRFLGTAGRLSTMEEHAYYLLHENDVEDLRYQNFVRPLYNKIIEIAPHCATGLDYGCGPGPVLAHMLRQKGLVIYLFDPLFNPDLAVFNQRYDFIICSEVVEHFRNPCLEFQRLHALLKPSGFLAIQTGIYNGKRDFANWHYIRDPTHVSFYSVPTLDWIRAAIGFSRLQSDGQRVAVLHK